MKQTRSKLTAHVMHVYIQHICFMFASLCKHPITDMNCIIEYAPQHLFKNINVTGL